jgi:hypothetical protein
MKRLFIAFTVLIALACSAMVYAADLHGIVTGKDGKPAADIKITLKDVNDAKVGEPAATDKTGAYAFKDIKPGNYTVFVDENNKWKIFAGPGETRRDLTLK